MKKNKIKIFSFFNLLGLVYSLIFPYSVNAYSFGLPPWATLNIDSSQMLTMANEIMGETESRYGFDTNILRNANRKVFAPRVEISFDNTNPNVGEKVTAHAIPEYFKNEAQNLYYTWYVIHTTDGTPQTATNSVKKGKIEAARIMTKGDYDSELDGQNYSNSGEDPDSDGWPAVDSNSFDADEDQAPMGGSDGVGGIASDSNNLDPSLSEYCSDKTQASICTLYTAKSAFDLYYQFNGTQNNTYCSACASAGLSWGTLSSDNQCCYLVQNPSDTTYSGYDSGTSYCPVTYDAAYESCFDYATLKSTNQAAIESCLYDECADDYNLTHATNMESGSNDNDYSRCFKHDFGSSNSAFGYRGYSGSSESYGNDDSGLDYNVACKHKWEDATGYTSGSGKFPTGEEKYWGTDPTDPDTDGDGFKDGADVIGLGQQDFTWNYQSGDRVGVVVEGTSMIPTDETNAYYKIMWGYPDVCDSTKTSLLADDSCDDSGDYGFGFLATKSPSEEGEEKLKVSLNYSPENPVADSSSDNNDNISADGTISDADKITITSSLDNTELESSNLYYTWNIQRGTLGDDNSWEKLDINDDFETNTKSSGLGLSSFSFKPKKAAMSGSGDIIYFKVTLTTSRSSGTESKRGRASVIIPVNKKGIHLDLYQVDIENGKATLGDEVCEGITYCPVVQNQMLAAKVSSSNYTSSNSDFSWNINGESYPTPSDPSDLFDDWNDKTIYFGIIESAGDTPSVSVTATPQNALQPVTGTRYLYVANPSISINSGDSSTSWGKNYTVEDNDTKDTTYTMESNTSFEAKTDSDVSYNLALSPSYLYSDMENVSIDWKINGTSIDSEYFSESDLDISGITTENDGKTLKFTTGSTVEDSYAIEVLVKRYWSADEKNILSTAWDITPTTLQSSASIDVATTFDLTEGLEETSLGNTGQILAAIGTHLPHYFMYLLRLVITIAVMFAVSALFYGISQNMSLANDDE